MRPAFADPGSLVAPPPEHRLALLRALQQQPGATVADLARLLGVHHSTAVYHVGRLHAAGAITLLKHRGRVHCFVAGRGGSLERARLVGGRSAHADLVLGRVSAAPQKLGAIAAGLPLSKAAVYWHLARLAELGLVVAEGAPKGRRYRLASPTPLPPAAPGEPALA